MKNLIKESWFIWVPIFIILVAISLANTKPKVLTKYVLRDKRSLDTCIIIRYNIKEVMNDLKINNFDDSNYEVIYFSKH